MERHTYHPSYHPDVRPPLTESPVRPLPIDPPANSDAVVDTAPSHDEIALRAYELYEKSGNADGNCQQNWGQAEWELRQPIQDERAVRTLQDDGAPLSATGGNTSSTPQRR